MLNLRRFALLALAFTSTALAGTCDEDFIIESNGDAAQLGSCQKFDGTLTIGSKVTSVVLPTGLTAITGDLVCKSATLLSTLQADGLRSIGGNFELTQLTKLSTLAMPQLGKVGAIKWTTLPGLKSLDFTTTVTDADSVEISDTILTTLTGINLKKASKFSITNNNYLKDITVGLTQVSDSLNINFNAAGVKASFPELKSAMNISIGLAGSITFPKLEIVNGSISFVNNSISDASFPKLKEVVQSFALVSCTELTNVSAPALSSVKGTFQLANNTKLAEVKGFPSLSEVWGAVDLSGAFTEVELPKLDDVRGGFNLQSTEDLNCDAFDKLQSSVVKGTYTCKGGQEVAESSSGGASTSGDGKGGEDDKEGAAGQIVANIGLAAFAGAAVLLAL